MLLREKVGVDTESSIIAVCVSMHFETHLLHCVASAEFINVKQQLITLLALGFT